jgi:hypothetical protein
LKVGIRGELAEIVGPENLLEEEEVLEEYSSDHSFSPPRRPSLVVRPGKAEEVRRIVEAANRYGVPLVPCSSGPPRFRGDTVPEKEGSIVLDLSGMREIIALSRRNKIAVIEPGVTFGQLLPELKRRGLRPHGPLLPRANKSVLASALEREPVLMPRYQWDLLDPLVCAEIVFGTGEVLRTGEAAMVESREELREGNLTCHMGPGAFDPIRLVQGAQGTMGVVTWGVIRCELLPTVEHLFFVPSPNLGKLVDLTYILLWRRLGEEIFLLNSLSLAGLLGKSREEREELRSSLPPWILILTVAGYERFPEERVEYQEEEVRAIARERGLELEASLAGEEGEEVRGLLEGPQEGSWRLRYGGFQEIPFLTTMDRTPSFVNLMLRMAEKHEYPPEELGVYIQPLVQGVCCHVGFDLFYGASEGRRKVEELFLRASEALLEAGAFFSRPYGPLARLVYERDVETARVLRKVKEIFDPRGILNPGKLCFWG